MEEADGLKRCVRATRIADFSTLKNRRETVRKRDMTVRKRHEIIVTRHETVRKRHDITDTRRDITVSSLQTRRFETGEAVSQVPAFISDLSFPKKP
jgi:hypothetical protein